MQWMGDFRSTRLWKMSLGHGNHDRFEFDRERLRNALEAFRMRAATLASEIPADVRDLTVHDVTHIDALWQTAETLSGDSIGLTPPEAFVLGGAFLVHDLGMGLAAYPGGLAELKARPEWGDLVVSSFRTKLERDPTSEEVANPPEDITAEVKFSVLRLVHAEQAERLTTLSWVDASGVQFHLIEDPELRAAFAPLIGRIAHSHWWPTEQLPQKFPSSKIGTPATFPSDWAIDAVKLALLLRLADAAHIDGDRAPAFLRALRRPKGLSDLHWLFQGKLYQVQREADKLVYTSQPFAKRDSQAWWLGYDTLRMVDTELRRADDLNVALHRERFASRGVKAVEDPVRLAQLLTTAGWLPVDAQVKVGRVADLVRKLGGRELYGDDTSVPLRELIQNAADAVRARRILEARSGDWGEIRLRSGSDEHGSWFEVEDNGVGMSTAVLTGPFLDFGNSLWSTDAITEFPGLLSKKFRSTGRYGIGFFSVFMWTDRVRVTTRRYDAAMSGTQVLEFESGLEGRPILRPAEQSEFLRDGGTRVRVWPRGVTDISSSWIRFESGHLGLYGRAGVFAVTRAICIAMDLNVLLNDPPKEYRVVRALDWLGMSGDDLLRRVASPDYAYAIKAELKFAGPLVRPLFHNGQIVGRAAICPGLNGTVAVGGFRSQTEVTIAGIIAGEATRASRDQAVPIVSEAELTRWADEQAKLIQPLDLSPTMKSRCGRLISALGGRDSGFPVARAGKTWLNFQELLEWSRDLESIIIIDESDEEKALGRFGASGLRSNVLVEPSAPDDLIAKSFLMLARQRTLAPRSTGPEHRPVLKAIRKAWKPNDMEVGKGEIYVDEDDEVMMDAEEVRRAQPKKERRTRRKGSRHVDVGLR